MGHGRHRQHPGRLLRHDAGPHQARGRRGARRDAPRHPRTPEGHAPGRAGTLRTRVRLLTMRTTVLFGGMSRERLVSVASAQALAKALPDADLWFWAPDDKVYVASREVLGGHARP